MIFLLIAMVYLTVGAFVARGVYGNQVAQLVSDPYESKRREIKAKLSAIVHDRSCYHYPGGEWYNTSRDCDCSKQAQWHEIKSELNALPPEPKQRVINPYLILAGYPFFGLHTFMTSSGGGKVSRNRAKELAEAQHNIRMAELREQEASILDRELEAAKR